MELPDAGTFSFIDGTSIRACEMERKDILESGAIGEDIIKRALLKYGFLNANLLQTHLNLRGHRRINGVKSAERMCATGDLTKHVIMREGLPDISVYSLSDSLAETMEAKSHATMGYRREMDENSIPYILECLSLAEYHMTAAAGQKASEQYYNHPVMLADGRPLILQSLIRYKNMFQHTIIFCAMVLPKGGSSADTAGFFENMLLTKEYFREKEDRYRNLIYVVICDTDQQIREFARLTDRMADIKEMFALYYRIPRFGADRGQDPFKRLYKCEWVGGAADMSLVKLK